LKKLESLEQLVQQSRPIIDNLNENNQKKINEIIQQYQSNSKQIKDKLNTKLNASSSRENNAFYTLKLRLLFCFLEALQERAMNFLQTSDNHIKKSTQFLSTLVDIQKDPSQTSKVKLEQLNVSSKLFTKTEIHWFI